MKYDLYPVILECHHWKTISVFSRSDYVKKFWGRTGFCSGWCSSIDSVTTCWMWDIQRKTLDNWSCISGSAWSQHKHVLLWKEAFCPLAPASVHAVRCSGVNYVVPWWIWRGISLPKTTIPFPWKKKKKKKRQCHRNRGWGDAGGALSKCFLWRTAFETIAWSWSSNSTNSMCVFSITESGWSVWRGLYFTCVP